MDDEFWCMQWSDEVVPEPAMVPDLSVFLRVACAHSRAISSEGTRRNSLFFGQRVWIEGVSEQEREIVPGLLRLPFILLPVEDCYKEQ